MNDVETTEEAPRRGRGRPDSITDGVLPRAWARGFLSLPATDVLHRLVKHSELATHLPERTAENTVLRYLGKQLHKQGLSVRATKAKWTQHPEYLVTMLREEPTFVAASVGSAAAIINKAQEDGVKSIGEIVEFVGERVFLEATGGVRTDPEVDGDALCEDGARLRLRALLYATATSEVIRAVLQEHIENRAAGMLKIFNEMPIPHGYEWTRPADDVLLDATSLLDGMALAWLRRNGDRHEYATRFGTSLRVLIEASIGGVDTP